MVVNNIIPRFPRPKLSLPSAISAKNKRCTKSSIITTRDKSVHKPFFSLCTHRNTCRARIVFSVCTKSRRPHRPRASNPHNQKLPAYTTPDAGPRESLNLSSSAEPFAAPPCLASPRPAPVCRETRQGHQNNADARVLLYSATIARPRPHTQLVTSDKSTQP